MSENRVGFVGLQRGMVGSVYLERSLAENDFERLGIEPVFLSTSEAGRPGPTIKDKKHTLVDAYDMAALTELDAIVTCQGDDYTKRMHGPLRDSGYDEAWLDASGELRSEGSSVLVSDVINGQQIGTAFDEGIRDFIGPNCSSNILAMGGAGLFMSGLVERVTFSTFQAASGQGAEAVMENLRQGQSLARSLHRGPNNSFQGPSKALQLMHEATKFLRSPDLDTRQFGQAIVANALACIGEVTDDGQTNEEKKAQTEINKILGTADTDGFITIDGTCTRIDSLRSHAIDAYFELKEDVPLSDIEQMITDAHPWVKLVPNTTEATLAQLTPLAVTDSLDIAVGRVRKLSHGPMYVGTRIIGDQLLQGAAEPLRRALGIVMSRRA
jgi:aspartate-semialdehyde dehydrogenase